jgi:hypothetical protein
MFMIQSTKLGLLAITLFCTSCAMEDSATSTSALESSPNRVARLSSLDRPILPAQDTVVATAAIVGVAFAGNQVGFYDMTFGAGQPYQVGPILAAGGNAIQIFDPSASALSGLNVLWVHNQDNSGFGAGYLARLTDIAAAVQNGMILVLHDRAVTGAAAILPGGAGIAIFRDFSEPADINIRDASTTVTAGLNDLSLDGGNASSHGFALANTLPARSKLLLSATTADHLVTFCYPVGKGAVIYSTIPLDFYLQFGFPPLALTDPYAPNTVKYAIAGACAAALTGPRPTPNRI